MSESYRTERYVSSPSGAVYELETTVNPTTGTYRVYFAVEKTSEAWDVDGEANPPEWARPGCLNGDAGWTSLDRSGYYSPSETSRATRTTIPIGWYRIANTLASNEEERRQESVRYSIPQKQPVEVALTIGDRKSQSDAQRLVKDIIRHYRRVYNCSAVSAYVTWLYDAALLLSDAAHRELTQTVESVASEVEGVVPGALSASEVRDTERISATKGSGSSANWSIESSDWLTGDGCVRFSNPNKTTNATVGSDSQDTSAESVRDWRFRRRVIQRYGTACAVCGLDIQSPSGDNEVEAAHVHAREHGGPDDPSNGIPLCHLHHWAYDAGWLAFSEEFHVLVKHSPGTDGHERFVKYQGEPLRLKTDARPDESFARKHREMHGFKAQTPRTEPNLN